MFSRGRSRGRLAGRCRGAAGRRGRACGVRERDHGAGAEVAVDPAGEARGDMGDDAVHWLYSCQRRREVRAELRSGQFLLMAPKATTLMPRRSRSPGAGERLLRTAPRRGRRCEARPSGSHAPEECAGAGHWPGPSFREPGNRRARRNLGRARAEPAPGRNPAMTSAQVGRGRLGGELGDDRVERRRRGSPSRRGGAARRCAPRPRAGRRRGSPAPWRGCARGPCS